MTAATMVLRISPGTKVKRPRVSVAWRDIGLWMMKLKTK
jgi:hypothetical protein